MAFFAWRTADDVVEDQSSPSMHPGNDIVRRRKACDNQRYFILGAKIEVVREPAVRSVNNLIDRERRDFGAGICVGERREFRGDPCEPIVEHLFRPRIERGKGADDAILA